jgi:hypothetical protein
MPENKDFTDRPEPASLWAKYLTQHPDHWVCAVCLSIQPNNEVCHCQTSPAYELTATGMKAHGSARTHDSIWLTEEEAALRYPNLEETGKQLMAVLWLAQARGVTPPEIASLCATMHAQVVADLRPNTLQLDTVTEVFREAVRTFMTDPSAQHG